MRSLVLAVTLFAGLAGCSRAPEPTTAAPPASTASSSTQALVSTPSSLTLDKSQNAICPQQWTCDFTHWFGGQAACNASAFCTPGSCFRDFNCNGHCVCP